MKAAFNDKYEYVDTKPFGCGTFGNVYLIRDKNLKTEYVLKEILKEEQESFENEINFLKDVKGANIINIIDFYPNKDDKYYYIVLEKMEGDLEKMLKKYKTGMPSELIRKIFLQLNSGLKEMIKNKKSHRDLKPSNILYTYTNEIKTDFVIKIGDFGLAKKLGSTKTGTNVGTDLFKAPEVEEGNYSNKCDLYSLGIILFMLKTNERIFEGKTTLDILLNKKLNKIKKKTGDKNLDDLIEKLVVNDPHKRIEWDDYFIHPFFKENGNDLNVAEESKINYLSKVKKLKSENQSYLNGKIYLVINRN